MSTTRESLVRSLRSEVRSSALYLAYVTENSVTRENVTEHAKSLATEAYPKDDGVQTKMVEGTKIRTDYGNAVQAAAAGMRKHLEQTPKPEKTPDWLALACRAVENACENGVDIATLSDAVTEVLRYYRDEPAKIAAVA